LKKRLLVIDALNMYFRAYIVDPSLSTNGQPIGGVKGFLKILQKMLRELKPDGVVICWDGPGGSYRRKKIVKEYKAGRKPIRLNRDIRNMSENEELENKIWQQTRLVELLNNMPIIQMMIPEVEADDLISWTVQQPKYADWQKVIISSDKDFFQLCDDETVVFRPIQKEVLNKNAIIEKFGIHPTNFALARAIAGDKSDNLPGVQGVGLPTVAKRLPFLAEQKTYTLDEVRTFCDEAENNVKAYTNIVEDFDKVIINYRMMQLYAPMIPAQGKLHLKHTIRDFKPELNKTEIRKMMIQDGFGEGNWSTMFQTFNRFTHEGQGE
jgi:DNA polymerase-1